MRLAAWCGPSCRDDLQVFADDGGRSRVVWIADVLPHDLAGPIGAMMDHGMRAMRQTLEGTRRTGEAA